MKMDEHIYDCIVVGAGPAGLSAALFLARYRRRVLTFHNSSPRNLYSHGVHGFLGHHGIMPEELLARGRDEVMKHGGLIIEGCVTRVEKIGEEHFRVHTGDEEKTVGADEGKAGGAQGESLQKQSFEARRILLATGLKDLTPDCPGFQDFYGVSVHHCPDCDGYEVSGKRVAVLSRGKEGVGFTLNLLTWTDKLTLLTDGDNGDISEEHREKLARFNITINDSRVVGLEG